MMVEMPLWRQMAHCGNPRSARLNDSARESKGGIRLLLLNKGLLRSQSYLSVGILSNGLCGAEGSVGVSQLTISPGSSQKSFPLAWYILMPLRSFRVEVTWILAN